MLKGNPAVSKPCAGLSGYRPDILVITQSVSPNFAPVLDRLATRFNILVVYLYPTSPRASWGDLEIRHPYIVLSDSWLNAAKILVAALRPGAPKALVVMGYKGPLRLSALVAFRLRRRPIVSRTDSNAIALTGEPRLKRAARRLAYRMIFPARTRIWTIGQANTSFWESYVGRGNTHLIPYSTPVLPDSLGHPPSPRKSDPTRMRFLFVGRLTAVKDVGLLIDAFEELTRPEEREWTLAIVGDGESAADWTRRAANDARISFHGAVDHHRLDEHYHQSDVLVLPSRQEAWGLVVSEALGFGLYAVVSDRVGASELISDPASGTVFPAGDRTALIAALRRAATQPMRRPVPPYDPTDDMADDLEKLLAGDDDAYW
ncbi:hypothetical protein GCM10011575_47000 [Microlunatus endophyticus]|uniref:Glycosyl transferase family 1 domain-containing protein n=2 Tax=Microlunatus endophyticus TaxID=1716077 RepID=A0A917SHY3_9ACTN|nr:hypothetical protein GCM10011575_47000 [Microlunatus endophyticus]